MDSEFCGAEGEVVEDVCWRRRYGLFSDLDLDDLGFVCLLGVNCVMRRMYSWMVR